LDAAQRERTIRRREELKWAMWKPHKGGIMGGGGRGGGGRESGGWGKEGGRGGGEGGRGWMEGMRGGLLPRGGTREPDPSKRGGPNLQREASQHKKERANTTEEGGKEGKWGGGKKKEDTTIQVHPGEIPKRMVQKWEEKMSVGWGR